MFSIRRSGSAAPHSSWSPTEKAVMYSGPMFILRIRPTGTSRVRVTRAGVELEHARRTDRPPVPGGAGGHADVDPASVLDQQQSVVTRAQSAQFDEAVFQRELLEDVADLDVILERTYQVLSDVTP